MAKVRRARRRVRALLEKHLQNRLADIRQQAQDTLISETKEARGDRPSASTRSTSTKPATVAAQEGPSNKKEHNKKKEPSWSGGTTHVRSKISERMVELISGLQRKGDG